MGYIELNLLEMLGAYGEDKLQAILSRFMCPQNADVENFIQSKAIDFARQRLAMTYLVFSDEASPELAGYFTLANKYITVSAKKLSGTQRKRLAKFSIYDNHLRAYCLSAPLIAQLGKNYANGYNKLITGDELLYLACRKVSTIQMDLGGKFAYLECEDKPRLIEFYSQNGFCAFDKRRLDRDETGMDGSCLVQMLKYIRL